MKTFRVEQWSMLLSQFARGSRRGRKLRGQRHVIASRSELRRVVRALECSGVTS